MEGYAIANIIALRPALNRVRSEVELFPQDYFLPQRRGLIRAVHRHVLRREELGEVDVLRLTQVSSAMFASARFKNTFEQGGFTGVGFYEVEVSNP